MEQKPTEIVLIGAGIMSATLAILLKELNPHCNITLFEKLDVVSGESSDALNNAGTGHSGYCELNYTPQKPDGTIDTKKAIDVAKSFELSREFWAYLVESGHIKNPNDFIRSTPHISFVWGDEDVNFLQKRWEALHTHPLFRGMEYSEDFETLKSWMPLVMENRDPNQKLAATRMDQGTDVNFGSLTRLIVADLFIKKGITLKVAHEVKKLKKVEGKWEVKVKNLATDKKFKVQADFVFIGAGGGSLWLLEKSGIEEAEGFGGFPVSGEWLICNNPEIIEKHYVKVYGKAKVGAPPMSVPHLDSRVIDGKNQLLFGPFAGFSTKFLKNGSYWDLPKSIEWSNIKPMLAAGLHNIPLTKYLIEQVSQSNDEKIEALREYYPNAQAKDWDEAIAGQRVQVIKKDNKEGGVLQFGTEIVTSKDGSIAALLGASPGASTSVKIMLDVIEKCFPEELKNWESKIKQMIPSYQMPDSDFEQLKENRHKANKVLQLND
jgi:malate dehydrogenase (quinone)